jgi:hypothetical protein
LLIHVLAMRSASVWACSFGVAGAKTELYRRLALGNVGASAWEVVRITEGVTVQAVVETAIDKFLTEPPPRKFTLKRA